MSINQLHPLQVNPHTGEPFLRLKSHPNIILTPPRMSDVLYYVEYLNDARVHGWLNGPPFPYLPEDAEAFLSKVKPECDSVLQELQEAQGTDTLSLVGGCPVRSIREVKEDGSDIFIGDVEIGRCGNGEFFGTDGVDWTQREARVEENNGRELGDPTIIWDFGDFLAPSHHGRGIMSDAVGTVLNEWAIPRMGVRRMFVIVFKGNKASVRVFLKNGFKLVRTVEEHFEVKGKMRGVHALEWSYTEYIAPKDNK